MFCIRFVILILNFNKCCFLHWNNGKLRRSKLQYLYFVSVSELQMRAAQMSSTMLKCLYTIRCVFVFSCKAFTSDSLNRWYTTCKQRHRWQLVGQRVCVCVFVFMWQNLSIHFIIIGLLYHENMRWMAWLHIIDVTFEKLCACNWQQTFERQIFYLFSYCCCG